MQEKNLVFEDEAQFNRFQKYCKTEGSKYHKEGFHLEYYTEPYSTGKKELENYLSARAPIVILRGKRSKIIIYDVAEFEREDWVNAFPTLREEFERKKLV